jgi:hypothetical protein
MNLVLTLIASPTSNGICNRIASRVYDALVNIGAAALPDWLSPGRVCDIVCNISDARTVQRLAIEAIENAPVDVYGVDYYPTGDVG